jgi:hypothetical protein
MKKLFYCAVQNLKNIQGNIVVEEGSYFSVDAGSDKVEINIVDRYGYRVDNNAWLLCTNPEVEVWVNKNQIQPFTPALYPMTYICADDRSFGSGYVIEAGSYQVFELLYSLSFYNKLTDTTYIVPKSDFATL